MIKFYLVGGDPRCVMTESLDFEVSEFEFENYIKKSKYRLIKAASNNIAKIRQDKKQKTKKKNKKKQETEMGRKTTVWRFQATN